jgi:hypothetical protein
MLNKGISYSIFIERFVDKSKCLLKHDRLSFHLKLL